MPCRWTPSRLLKRLSVDGSYRDELVKIASTDFKPAAGTTDPKETAKASLALLASPSIDLLPKRTQAGLLPQASQIPGILFAWVLLSLGAPFWFDLLKNLLKLRSLLARKDEAEREARQQTQTQTPALGSRASAPAASGSEALGEAGDLAATGALG